MVGSLLFTLVFVGYSLTLTRNYAYELVAYIWPTVETGLNSAPELVWYQNHLLHVPLMSLLFRLWQLLGYEGRAILPTQTASALLGSLTAVFIFLTVWRIAHSLPAAVLAALGAAFGRSLWFLSTDAWYYTLYLAGASVVTWLVAPLLADEAVSKSRIVVAGIALALTTLAAQITVLVMPAIAVALWWTRGFRSRSERWQCLIAFFGVFWTIVAIGYLTVGVLILERRSLDGIISWLTSRPDLPMWGRWELIRLVQSFVYVLGSFVPVTEGIGLRAFLRGEFDRTSFLSVVSVIVFVFFGLAMIMLAARERRNLWFAHRTLVLFCVAWIVPMWVFQMWFEPMAMSSSGLFIPMWLLIAVILAHLGQVLLPARRSVLTVGAGLVLLLMALGNYEAVIQPRHSRPNTDLEKALVAANKMTKGDLLIGVRWNWTFYLPYFGARDALNLINTATGRWSQDQTRAWLCKQVADREQKGGHVYLTDTSQYSPADWDWLLSPKGAGLQFGPGDFAALPKQEAWILPDGEVVWKLEPCDHNADG